MSTVRFLPWLRTGLAARLPEHEGGALPAEASVDASVTVDGVSVKQTLRLHGPGAVKKVRAAEFGRCEPTPGSLDFEGNLMPFVELTTPDLPWRYTPAGPDEEGRLRPWLVLVAVEERRGVRLERGVNGRALVIDSGAADMLPDLSESWAWAHVQLPEPVSSQAELDEVLRARARACRSRLVCGRRLADDTAYIAAVVPAFQQGVDAAEGREPSGDTLDDAWQVSGPHATNAVRLPVFHSWRFRTAAAGDFEALIRRLQPTPLPDDTGSRRLDLGDAGAGLPAIDDAATRYLGALRSVNAAQAWEPAGETEAAFGDALEAIVTETDVDEPVVGPPTWGERYATWGTAPWVAELNRHPAWRAAAALGAATIQSRQEYWMGLAWDQAGEQREVQALVNRARLASAVGSRLRVRVDSLGDEALVGFGRALGKRVAGEHGTVAGSLARSALPHGLSGGALRRVARPTGHVRRAVRSSIRTRLTGGATSVLQRARTQTLQVAATSTFHPAPDRMIIAVDAFGGTLTPEEIGAMAASFASTAIDPARLAVAASPFQPVAAPPPAPIEPDGGPLARAAAHLRASPAPGTEVWRRLDGRVSGTAWSAGTAPRTVRVSLSMPASLQADLVALDPDWLLPGAASLPAESVGLVTVDRRVVEAFLIGANHEMRRELAWRGLPVSAATAPFLHFWTPERADVPAPSWAGALGANAVSDPALTVFLVRGALVQRYPDAVYELVAATWAVGAGDVPRRLPNAAETPLQPVFQGTLAPDTLFVGFAVAPEAAAGDAVVEEEGAVSPVDEQRDAGWFLRISERPAGPRFGLDLEQGAPDLPDAGPITADALSWAHVGLGASGRLTLWDMPLDGRDIAVGDSADPWAATSAALARQLTQRPFRMLVHAGYLLRGSV